ncbi:MAG: dTDP-glucose 4,6-dehydratase [Flavobacteriales bacterium]|nr:dTDP-glucose 4,6-dehydratase [Flavobacteriales bacterium]
MTASRTLLITGGAGFIGSHVVRLFAKKYPQYRILNLDVLTYAGNLENLRDVQGAPNYSFIKADIRDAAAMAKVFAEHRPDGVIHLAAESHVDRSISDPMAFVETNVTGTVNLLNAAREAWKDRLVPHSTPLLGRGAGGEVRFYHVSTDEVYGSLHDGGFFTESTPYDPQSPYSASKAASDHFVRAYGNTYKLPFVISNCSNNYGSHQFPEKLIPLMIHNLRNGKPLPVYGKGENVRDWLWVEDHARAIDVIFHQGVNGETYNIGGHNEWKNIDLVQLLCSIMDRKLGRAKGESAKQITYVADRAGHDLRYAIDASKIGRELGWKPSITFEQGLEQTVDWYLANDPWLQAVTSGAYRDYYAAQYGDRG